MPRKNPGPPCAVCGKESVARKLCATHYKRFSRHGHLETTRPEDWGLREKHSLYGLWCWARRYGMTKEWLDFWVFVSAVGERPTAKHRLRRRDIKKDIGPNNWFWSDPISETILGDKASKALYQREWRKKNPLKSKNNALKKIGFSLPEYEKMLNKQNGGCAICKKKDKWFRLAVDHCHGTKKIRGLLCSQCNRGLGIFHDSTDLLKHAIAYLARSKK